MLNDFKSYTLIFFTLFVASCFNKPELIEKKDCHTSIDEIINFKNDDELRQTLSSRSTCILNLWDDVRLAEFKQATINFKNSFLKKQKSHNADYGRSTSLILLEIFPDDKDLTQASKSYAKMLKSRKIQPTTKASKDISVVKRSMDFDSCHKIAYQQAEQLGLSFNVIVDTKIMLVIKVPTDNGSVLITCSKPDHQLTISQHGK